MNYNSNGWTFDQVKAEIIERAAEQEHQTHKVPIVELAKGYSDDGIKIGSEKYVLTENGLRQLFSERLDAKGLDTWKRLNSKNRKAFLVDLAGQVDENNAEVTVQTSRDGVDGILGGTYQPIPNNLLAIILGQTLPEDAKVHRWHMTEDARNLDLRVVAKESWGCDLGNGRPDPGFGAIHIRNNESGNGKLLVKHAIARIGCLNYVITSEVIMEQQHRFVNVGDLQRQLTDGVSNVPGYTERISAEMRGWRHVPVDDVNLAFQRIGERGGHGFGVPTHVIDSAREYWQAEGEEHNLFAVTQAMAHGLKFTTDNTPPRVRENWDRRVALEEFVYDEALAVVDHADHWRECAACHQALPEGMLN